MVALIGGVLGSAPIYVMGLVVPIFIVGPLALLTGCLIATLSAGWVANLSSNGASSQTRSRFGAIFAVALAASLAGLLAGMAGGFAVNEFGIGMRFGVDVAIVYLPGAILFSAATTIAVWRFLTPASERLGFLGGAALVLAAAWLGLIVFVGSSLVGGPGYRLLYSLAPGLDIMVLFGVSFILTVIGIFLVIRFFRGGAGRGLQRDAVLSLVAVGLMPAVIAGTISLGCSVSYCGP